MSATTLRPMCFIAMPFGQRQADGMSIDFNEIHTYLHQGAEAAGLEAIRADFEPSGGFIHKPMIERLLVAEYVIADLTLANPNVTYEVGVRHGATARASLLVCAEPFLKSLPFDFKPLRVLPYTLSETGSLPANSGDKLAGAVRTALTAARSGQLQVDNPILQITAWKPAGSIEHSKTDVFLERLQFTGELGKRIKSAIAIKNAEEATARLTEIEEEVVGLPPDVTQVHSALIGVYLGYREKKAYQRMVSLFHRFPRELQQTAVAREQCALALNRLAEGFTKAGDQVTADQFRTDAISTLDEIPAASVTSETFGIRGRIYKGWHDALRSTAGDEDLRAQAMLQRAIDTYEQGLRADLRDYFPGVNAVTLRLLRGSEEDKLALNTLLPVVQYSVDCAPAAKNDEERYWQTATRLELSTAGEDWTAAKRHLVDLLSISVSGWMHETTLDNLKRQQLACGGRADAVGHLETIIKALKT